MNAPMRRRSFLAGLAALAGSSPVDAAARRLPRGAKRHKPAYSLAQLTALPYAPPDLLALAARTGYQFAGVRVTEVTPGGPHWPLDKDKALLRATKAAIAATGVGVLDFEVFLLGPTTVVADYEPVIAAGAELGVKHLLTQCPDPDRSRAIDHFAQMCDIAARYGLTADLEFPSWMQVGDLGAAAEVVSKAGKANGGILIDPLHLFRSGGSPAQVAALPRNDFNYMQMCDAPAAVPPTLEGLLYTAREARDAPGQGELDLKGLMGAMPPGLVIALEIPNSEEVKIVGYEAHCLRVRQVMDQFLGFA
ncbi:MAG TPA: sugar phosphate isomerase/epimerase [Caulobacteraceae bacterium]|nr:sugar phosphate isomerase/epimerase [Caulobacteraceae bacterium]